MVAILYWRQIVKRPSPVWPECASTRRGGAPLKILILQESDWLEKGPHQLHHLAERLRKRGHEVQVVDFEIRWKSSRNRGLISRRQTFADVHKAIDLGGVTVIRPAFVRLAAIDYASILVTHHLETVRQIRESKPDVVIGLGILNAFTGIRLSAIAGIPFVYYLLDTLHGLVEPPIFAGLAKLFEQHNLRRATLVLSINEALRDYTVGMGARPERTRVVGAGVDLARYANVDGYPIRRSLALMPADTVLFFMGEFYPFSGLREVAESIVRMDPHERQPKLLAVGRGAQWADLQRLRDTHQHGSRILLEKWQPYSELPRYLAAADVCILPAHENDIMRDIVPIKLYEYMAAGKPVITTRLPGVVREFGDSHGVVYVKRPEEVVPKALELVQAGGIGELGAEAREYVAKFDWEAVTDQFERILCEVARNPLNPAEEEQVARVH